MGSCRSARRAGETKKTHPAVRRGGHLCCGLRSLVRTESGFDEYRCARYGLTPRIRDMRRCADTLLNLWLDGRRVHRGLGLTRRAERGINGVTRYGLTPRIRDMGLDTKTGLDWGVIVTHRRVLREARGSKQKACTEQ